MDKKLPKAEIFSQWLANDGDWLQVCYSTGLRVITSDSSLSRHRLMTKTEIEKKFVNPGLQQTPYMYDL